MFKGQGYSKTHGDFVDGVSGQGSNEDDHGVEIWEHPPNGQGIVALMALGIFEALEETGKIPHFTPDQHNSAAYLHAVIESLRIAFVDNSSENLGCLRPVSIPLGLALLSSSVSICLCRSSDTGILFPRLLRPQFRMLPSREGPSPRQDALSPARVFHPRY